MARTEAANAAGVFCYLAATVAGASGLVALVTRPRLTGLARLAAAGALAWSAQEPTSARVRTAARVSAGLAVLDLVNGLRPGVPTARRTARLTGAAYHTVLAVTFNEATRDI